MFYQSLLLLFSMNKFSTPFERINDEKAFKEKKRKQKMESKMFGFCLAFSTVLIFFHLTPNIQSTTQRLIYNILLNKHKTITTTTTTAHKTNEKFASGKERKTPQRHLLAKKKQETKIPEFRTRRKINPLPEKQRQQNKKQRKTQKNRERERVRERKKYIKIENKFTYLTVNLMAVLN